MYKCRHFGIKELVSKQVYEYFTKLYGESFCWRFFSEQELRDLDTIRDYHGQEIIINNWASGGSFSQCGLRSNVDPLVKSKTTPYCSGHTLGKAFDLHSSDCHKLYKDVDYLMKNGKLKALKRIESPVSTKYGWCHVDSLQTLNGQIEYFKG